MKKVFCSLLAVAALVSCSNDDGPKAPEETKGTSYVSFSICASSDISRAADGFSEGTDAENAISIAQFFFFDKDGNAFKVNDESFSNTNDALNVTGGKANYVNATVTTTASTGNVEEILATTLVIKHNKGTIPAKVVAVLNLNYDGEGISLENLSKHVVSEENASTENKFIMANSVYKSKTEEVKVDAVEITNANLGTTPEEAKNVPVEIYVERVAAKVSLTTKENTTYFKVGEYSIDGATAQPVYAKIVGWDLNGTANQATLMKQLKPEWLKTAPFTGWNDPTNFRSYWALDGSTTTTGWKLNESFTWNTLSNAVGTNLYTVENISDINATADANNEHEVYNKITKAIVAVEFYDADNDNADKVVIANWMGHNYSLSSLKEHIANIQNLYLKTEEGTNDGKTITTYTKIKPEQIDIKQGVDNVDQYKCGFVLANGVSTENWCSKNQDGSYTEDANPSTVLAAVEKASIWNGMGYYIVNIKHIPTNDNPKYTTGSGWSVDYGTYGIIRNHYYQIVVDNIQGLGTPVYNPEEDLKIDEPEVPETTESFLAARINILSWRIVSQNVTLQ